jgi:hypothetical protein
VRLNGSKNNKHKQKRAKKSTSCNPYNAANVYIQKNVDNLHAKTSPRNINQLGKKRNSYLSDTRMRRTSNVQKSFDDRILTFITFIGQKSTQNSFQKIYRNVTGPGEYEPAVLTGRFVSESHKKNQPSFSFGYKHDYYSKKSPIISKGHLAELMMRDSPGAGTYSPEHGIKKFNQTSLKWSMPRDTRFKGPESEDLIDKRYFKKFA